MNRTISRKGLSNGLVILSAVGALAAVSAIGAPAAAQWVPPPSEYVDHEPQVLADHRAHFAPVRRSYGRGGRR